MSPLTSLYHVCHLLGTGHCHLCLLQRYQMNIFSLLSKNILHQYPWLLLHFQSQTLLTIFPRRILITFPHILARKKSMFLHPLLQSQTAVLLQSMMDQIQEFTMLAPQQVTMGKNKQFLFLFLISDHFFMAISCLLLCSLTFIELIRMFELFRKFSKAGQSLGKCLL